MKLYSKNLLGGGNSLPSDLVDYIVEYSSDNTSWYRKWKSGWIEQGGRVESRSGYGYQYVSFVIPFSSTNYTIQGSMIFTTSSTAGDYRCIRNLTAEGCDMAYNGSAFSWYACGF